MNKSLFFKISGHVQGVGFRMWTLRLARHHSIGGWVSNGADGCVYIRAEGTPSNISAFELDLEKGSPYSSISSIQKKHVTIENFSTFEIC